MTGSAQHIIKRIFQANSLSDVSLHQLEELVEQNPSFAIGHYLLSQKLQQEKDPAFPQQIQKTSLYFTNPFWLQWLLKNGHEEKITIAPENAVVEKEQLTEQIPGNIEENEDKQDEIAGSISKTVLQQFINASTEIKEKEEALAFEPYYTIDYFASQGIKFVQEVNPDDKLGRQLKSFTEWLKVMKRLPQKTIEQPIDDKTQEAIETGAAQSIIAKEVVTEAMAEVLLKQGKMEEAAEMYRKLSLHNPGKNAYFAAKIEQLKA
jgi:hypothetical protein